MLPLLAPHPIAAPRIAPKLRVEARWTSIPVKPAESSPPDLTQDDYGLGLNTTLKDGKIVTVRVRDGVQVGSFPVPILGAATFTRAGYAIWTKREFGRGAAGPFDLRDGREIDPDIHARFGLRGQYDVVQANHDGGGPLGDVLLVRNDVKSSVPGRPAPSIWICQSELGYGGCEGTGDGPYAFRFEGLNPWNAGWRLVTTRFRAVPIDPYLLHGVEPAGFLLSLKVAGEPLGEREDPGRPARDLTLVDPASGKIRWTRPMIASSENYWRGSRPSFLSGIPIVETERGIVVLDPRTGRTLLTKPWPRGEPLLGYKGVYKSYGPKDVVLARYRFDLRVR